MYSFGIFQINLTQHELNGIDCTKAFQGKNNAATVIDKALYAKCAEMAKNPQINIQEAHDIFEKHGWSSWGAYNNNSYNNYLN